jgi:hypothetical protein
VEVGKMLFGIAPRLFLQMKKVTCRERSVDSFVRQEKIPTAGTHILIGRRNIFWCTIGSSRSIVVAQSCRSIVAAQIAQPIERNLFVQLGFRFGGPIFTNRSIQTQRDAYILQCDVKRIQSAPPSPFSQRICRCRWRWLQMEMVADVVTIPGRSNGPSIFPEGGCG